MYRRACGPNRKIWPSLGLAVASRRSSRMRSPQYANSPSAADALRVQTIELTIEMRLRALDTFLYGVLGNRETRRRQQRSTRASTSNRYERPSRRMPKRCSVVSQPTTTSRAVASVTASVYRSAAPLRAEEEARAGRQPRQHRISNASGS